MIALNSDAFHTLLDFHKKNLVGMLSEELGKNRGSKNYKNIVLMLIMRFSPQEKISKVKGLEQNLGVVAEDFEGDPLFE